MKAAPFLALAATLSCNVFNPDFQRIVALQLDVSPRTITVGDTLRLTATAFDAANRVVLDASIGWVVLDTGQVGFTLDSISGLVTGTAVGSGTVQAWVESIRSPPVTIKVDSIAAAIQTPRRTAEP